MGDAQHTVCVVVVDIRSTYNVGSIFRSCDGFGATLFLVGISPQPAHENDMRLPHISQKAHNQIAKTALGAELTVNWRYAGSLAECVKTLHDEGFAVYGIEQDGSSKDIRQLRANHNVALVLGREVEGLTETEKALCEELFEINMHGTKESFNVSVAAGIALYQTTQ